jgi:aryl-alcohol dehydrogenase-like predicted oxidoreductase
MSFTGEGGWENIARTKQEDADRLTAYAIDQGINFFDTADIYSHGNSEIMLGKALGNKRKNVIIATKCGFRMHDGPNGDGLSRKRIIEACEESLRRLGTDYIDLYQMHSYDFVTPLEESLQAFDQLVKEGKVRYIGCSNFTGWHLMKAMSLMDKNGWEKIISLQAYYSLVGRDLELELVPVCLDQGIGILPWSPLHGGVLSGKYRKSKAWPKDTRMSGPEDSLPYDADKGDKILDGLEEIAQKRERTIAQVALNYLLCKPGVDSIVIGARNDKQLSENIKVSDWQLTEEEVKQLDEISSPPKLYPQWYFDIFRKDRM